MRKRKTKRKTQTRKSGGDYELHCISKMRMHGYLYVKQCGNSSTPDFGADIVARGFMFAKIVVQCKYYSKPVGVRAVQEVNAARQYYGASRAAVATNSTFTKAARELAKRCNVELWEGF